MVGAPAAAGAATVGGWVGNVQCAAGVQKGGVRIGSSGSSSGSRGGRRARGSSGRAKRFLTMVLLHVWGAQQPGQKIS